MEIIIFELADETVVTPANNEIGAYCVFRKSDVEQDYDAVIVVDNWFVSREFRNRGIGREVFKAAIREAKTRSPGLSIQIVISPLDEDMDYSRLVKFFSNENFLVSAFDTAAF